MNASALAPDATLPLPGSAATAVAWRAQGTLHVTVIAKATFDFASDAAMPRTEPQEILRAEVHHGGDPGRSVRFTSDLAPALARADVLFTGAAHAPPGAPVHSLPVRLALYADQRPLLDKRLVVHDPGGASRMPLVYERTGLGLDGTENPLGLARTAGVAIIVDPAQPGRPAGFGPIGRTWPARKRLLGAVPRRVLEGPVAEIPDGFDWAYFQAASPDQQIELLRGDEWIIFEGLHPELPKFRTRLPGARASARVHGLSPFGVSEGQQIELHADTLRIDGNAQQCTVVWRRSFPVASEAALGAVRIVAGVAVGGEALVWVEPSAAGRVAAERNARSAPPPATPRSAPRTVSPETVVLSPDAAEALGRGSALRFRPGLADPAIGTSQRAVEPAIATGTLAIGPTEGEGMGARDGFPFHDGAASDPDPRASAEPFARTVALQPEPAEAAAQPPVLPFREGIPGGAQPGARSASKLPEGKLTGTLALGEQAPPPDGDMLPFAPPAPPPARRDDPPPSPRPTAEAQRPAPDPAPPPDEPPPAVRAEARSEAPAPRLPAPPPPQKPDVTPRRASPVWAPQAEAAPPARSRPPARPGIPRPDPALKRGLYDRFDRRR